MCDKELCLDYYFKDMENFYIPDVFRDVQYPWEVLVKAKQIIEKTVVQNNLRECRGQISEGCYFSGNFLIGEGTVIHSNVTIEGPVIIGDHCTIMPGALIRPGSLIGNNCVIGHGCEIKNSVISNRAKIQSLTFVGDSIIGKSARVGSGTIVANRRFDQGEVGLKVNGNYYKFGVEFFGCVLGDNSRIGANSVTLPGTFIGPFTWIMPLTTASGFIPKEKRVSNKKELVLTENKMIELKP